MAKVTLTDFANIVNSTQTITKLNNNNTAIETAMEKTLSRDGTSPNEMEADLDMNDNRIFNLPEPTLDSEPATKGYVDPAIEGIASIEANAAAAAASAAAAATSASNALTAETNAETAETNAETAETNAETAATNAATSETNAETAATTATTKAAEAAQSAADAALDGGAVSPLPDGVISDLYENALITRDGNLVVGEFKNTVVSDIGNNSTVVYAEDNEYGSVVVLDAVVDATYSAGRYEGPKLETVFWVSDPLETASGEYEAKVSYDRVKAPHQTGDVITFTDADQGIIDADIVADKQFIFPVYAQSLGSSIGTAGETISTAAVDSGNALMPGLSTYSTPVVGVRSFLGTVVDLREEEGESLCSGFGAKFLALANARGGKVKSMVASAAVGGAELFNLLTHNSNARPDDASIFSPYWSGFTRTLRNCRDLTINISGKTPVLAPLMVPGPGYTESSDPVTLTPEFIEWMERFLAKWNAAARKEFRWSPGSPDLPMVVTFPSRTAENTYTGTTPELVFDIGGPPLAGWELVKRNPGIIVPGPDYHLEAYSDNTHPSPEGMYYLGEMFARCMDAIMWGNGWTPVMPDSFTRVSETVFTVHCAMNSGNIEIDDGTFITDYNTGVTTQVRKGFLIWSLETGLPIPISSVTATGLDRDISITIESGHAGEELAVDYGLWRDLSTGGNFGKVIGARGHARSSTSHTTTLSGGVAQNDWMIQFREKLPFTNGHNWKVKKAF